jgi:hypothetical protein
VYETSCWSISKGALLTWLTTPPVEPLPNSMEAEPLRHFDAVEVEGVALVQRGVLHAVGVDVARLAEREAAQAHVFLTGFAGLEGDARRGAQHFAEVVLVAVGHQLFGEHRDRLGMSRMSCLPLPTVVFFTRTVSLLWISALSFTVTVDSVAAVSAVCAQLPWRQAASVRPGEPGLVGCCGAGSRVGKRGVRGDACVSQKGSPLLWTWVLVGKGPSGARSSGWQNRGCASKQGLF